MRKLYQPLLLCIFLCLSINQDSLFAQVNNCNASINAGSDTRLCENPDGGWITLSPNVSDNVAKYFWTDDKGNSYDENKSSINVFVAETTCFNLEARVLTDNLVECPDFGDDFDPNPATCFMTEYAHFTRSNQTFPPPPPNDDDDPPKPDPTAGEPLLGNPGSYAVVTNARDGGYGPGFVYCGDHTTGDGAMLLFNLSARESRVWCNTFTVFPNSDYVFQAWVSTMGPLPAPPGPGDPDAPNGGPVDGDCDDADPDRDGDGICDSVDNCPGTANPDQADGDGNGVGDACDTGTGGDTDGDGIPNGQDNCPDVANPDQQDRDGNGIGDACEGDEEPGPDPDFGDGYCIPNLYVEINGEQIGDDFKCPQEFCSWVDLFRTWNSGNATTAEICIWDNCPSDSGNFLGMDDIYFGGSCEFNDDRKIYVDDIHADLEEPAFLACNNPLIVLEGSVRALNEDPNSISAYWTQNQMLLEDEDDLTLEVDEAGEYTFIVLNVESGCSATATVVVDDNFSPPEAIFSAEAYYINCENPTVVLDGSGSTQGEEMSYNWVQWSGNFVSGTDTDSPTVDEEGYYYVTITNDFNGCTSVASLSVFEDFSQPEITGTTSYDIQCFDPNITFDLVSNLTDLDYDWQTTDGAFLGGTDGPNPVVSSAGTYTLLASHPTSSCTQEITVTVTGGEGNPDVSTQQAQDLNCTITETTLSGSATGPGTLDVTWTDANGNIIANANDVTINAPGTYTYTATVQETGCSSSQEVVIAQNTADPQFDITAPSEINCTTGSTSLQGNFAGDESTVNISWTSTNGNISTGSNTLNPEVNAAGTYTLTITDIATGCFNTASVTVIENADIPDLNLSTVNEIDCNFSTVEISSSSSNGNLTYDWTSTDGNFVSNNNTSVVVDQPGTYTLNVQDPSTGCVNQEVIVIETNFDEPQIDLAQPNDVTCLESVVNINASGAGNYTYNWSTSDGSIVSGATAASLQVNGSGTYTVMVMDNDNGCVSSQTINVNENLVEPNVAANGGGILTCTDNSLSLSADVLASSTDYAVTWTTAGGSFVNGQNTLNPEVGAAGTYTVIITNNDNGCSAESSVVVEQNMDLPTATISTPQDLNCSVNQIMLDAGSSSSGNNFEIAWTSSNGGSITSGGSTLNPMVDATGTYTVVITNTDNDCTATASINVNENTATPTADIQANQEINCNTTSVTLGGGATSLGSEYTYQWLDAAGNPVAGATSSTFFVNQAGAYTLIVTNTTNGCTAESFGTVNENTSAPDALAQANGMISCNTQSLTLDGNSSSTGGNYSYQWMTSDGFINAAGNTLNPEVTAGGTYTLVVTNNDNGCSSTTDVTVQEDTTEPTSNAGATFVMGCGQDSAVLDGSGSSAGAGIQYTWYTSNGSILADGNTASPTIGSAGMYTLEVVNTINGCINVSNVTITQATDVDATVELLSNASCIGEADGSAIASANSGTGPFTYLWSNGVTENVATGLAAGSYIVEVTDAFGCSSVQTINISEPLMMQITSSVSPEVTYESNNGAISLTLIGGTGPYTYAWSNGQTTSSLSDLAPGDYSVIITDANGCTTNQSFTIEAYECILGGILTPTDASCSDASDGSLIINLSDAANPVNFSWENAATGAVGGNTESLDGLAPGTYSVIATDANNCTISLTVEIDAPSAIAGAVSETQMTGNSQDDGTASVTVTGGVMPYTYDWSNGETTSSISGLGEGTYTVMITDANGCTLELSTIINDVECTIAATSNGSDASCNGAADGSAEVTVSGTNGALTYSWSNGAIDASLNNLEAGTYEVTATDEFGCQVITSVTVAEPAVLDYTSSLTSIDCNGDADGSISLELEGGTEPYSVMWNTGDSSYDLFDLDAGVYSAEITDANGCIVNVSFDVEQPDALTLDAPFNTVTENGASDGSITLIVEGGSMPYTYTWSNGATTSELTDLSAGAYSVVIEDANGCQIAADFDITEPNALAAEITGTDAVCFQGMTGSATVNVTSGEAPYTYEWNNGMTGATIENVPAGEYICIVTDANGVEIELTVVVNEPERIITSAISTPINCIDDTNGTATISAIGGTPPFTYQWNDTTFGDFQEGLAGGSYRVTATDANGCQAIHDVVVDGPDPFTYDLTIMDVSCFDGSDGVIIANPLGGTPGYEIIWSNGVEGPDNSGISAGEYSFELVDANGCTNNRSFVINQPDELLITESSTTDATVGASDGTIDITVEGGTMPYTFAWSNGGIIEDLNGVPAGDYTVEVTDANGCVVLSETITVTGVTSTIDLSLDQFISVYPNPNNGQFDVIMDFGAKRAIQIELYDVIGRLIMPTQKLNTAAATQRISMPDPAAGVYVLKIQVDDSVITKKIVID